jgi:hypothetical protein
VTLPPPPASRALYASAPSTLSPVIVKSDDIFGGNNNNNPNIIINQSINQNNGNNNVGGIDGMGGVGIMLIEDPMMQEFPVGHIVRGAEKGNEKKKKKRLKPRSKKFTILSHLFPNSLSPPQKKIPGSSADLCGLIAPLDRLVGVDIYSVTGRPLSLVTQFVRGPVSSTVTLYFRRGPRSVT